MILELFAALKLVENNTIHLKKFFMKVSEQELLGLSLDCSAHLSFKKLFQSQS